MNTPAAVLTVPRSRLAASLFGAAVIAAAVLWGVAQALGEQWFVYQRL